MNIYIPTLKRVDKQVTWEQIPADWKPRTYLVCPEEEVVQHISKGRNVITCNERGIGNVRQWLLENSPTDHLLMIDDDQMFFKWKSPDDYHLKPCSDQELSALFTRMEGYLRAGEVFVGLGSRQGNNNHFPNPLVENIRNCNTYAVNRGIIGDMGIKFNVTPLMEDFYVQLSLLTKGIRTICVTDHVWNQYGSGAKGGCSEYRTQGLQKQAAEMLNEAFPKYVKLVTKQNKTGWEGLENRTDVIVYWKKAYNDGRNI